MQNEAYFVKLSHYRVHTRARGPALGHAACVSRKKTRKRFVGALLLQLMKREGLDRPQLAQRLGVSLPHVHNMIRGTRPAGDQTLEAISQAFGVPMARLLGTDDEALPAAGTIGAKGRVIISEGVLMRSVVVVEQDVSELGLRYGDSIVVEPGEAGVEPDRWYVLKTPDDIALARFSNRKGELVWRYADTANLIVFEAETHKSLGRIVERRHRM